MSKITNGEQWKMSLLSGESKPSEAVDMLMDNILSMTNGELAQVLLPMAELRASQIDRGLTSDDAKTRDEAERMHKRYTQHDVLHPQQEAIAMAAVEKEGAEHSDLAKAVASSWLEKIVANDRVGEMEKELQRTVDTYKTEKQEKRLTLRHAQKPDAASVAR